MLEQFEQVKVILSHGKRWLLLILIIVGGLLLFFASRLPVGHDSAGKTMPSHVSNHAADQKQKQDDQKQVNRAEHTETKILIDIKGAVKQPGVYDVSQQPRLQAAVAKAGGLTDQAEIQTINLAQKLTDGQMVYIPTKGERLSEPITASSQAQKDKVNLNTATVAELQTLEGIGEKKAEQIIAYREANGGFKQISDLKAVSGIGEKRFETLKDSLTV